MYLNLIHISLASCMCPMKYWCYGCLKGISVYEFWSSIIKSKSIKCTFALWSGKVLHHIQLLLYYGKGIPLVFQRKLLQYCNFKLTDNHNCYSFVLLVLDLRMQSQILFQAFNKLQMCCCTSSLQGCNSNKNIILLPNGSYLHWMTDIFVTIHRCGL